MDIAVLTKLGLCNSFGDLDPEGNDFVEHFKHVVGWRICHSPRIDAIDPAFLIAGQQSNRRALAAGVMLE